MGMGILGTVMQGAGTAGGLATGIQTGNAQEDVAKDMIRMVKQIHEEGSGERQRISQQVRADQDIARQNLLAGESARLNVLSSLGTPGSYGPSPGSTTGPLSLGVLQPTGLSGIRGVEGGILGGTEELRKTGRVTGKDVALGRDPKWKGEKAWEVTGAELDPEAMAAEVKNTSGFRTVSAMVAEAEQLMNRTGPLWDQLNNSVVGSIYSSNAAFHKQTMDEVSRAVARGGSARRAGLQMVQAFTAQEQINRTRTNQLWQAKMGLEQYRTQYAQQATNFAQNWVNNHAGIRDSFTNAVQGLQMFWSQTLAPTLAGATVGAQSATQQGVLEASQGLYDAIQTRSAAVQGAFQTLSGMGAAMGGYLPSGSEGGGLSSLTKLVGSSGGGTGSVPSSASGLFSGMSIGGDL